MDLKYLSNNRCQCFCFLSGTWYFYEDMSSSAFFEIERKKLKMEWEQLPNPKPSWEDYKLIKYKKTFK